MDQVKLALDEKLAIGQSKYLDKTLNQTNDKIYSWETYRNYLKHNCYFALWCKENYKCKTLEQCRSHVNEWLTSRSQLSAYTVKLEAAALAKLYQCSTKDLKPELELAQKFLEAVVIKSETNTFQKKKQRVCSVLQIHRLKEK